MGIEFDEDTFGKRTTHLRPVEKSAKTGSKTGDWLIKNGLAKDVASANLFLSLASLLIFAFSIYIFMFGLGLPQSSPDVPQETPVPSEPAPLEN